MQTHSLPSCCASDRRKAQNCETIDHMSVRNLLARVQRLEQARAPVSPFERWFGSLDAFRGVMLTGMDAGLYDRTDIPVVIEAIEGWHRDGPWAR
jgi:hypothetical protein